KANAAGLGALGAFTGSRNQVPLVGSKAPTEAKAMSLKRSEADEDGAADEIGASLAIGVAMPVNGAGTQRGSRLSRRREMVLPLAEWRRERTPSQSKRDMRTSSRMRRQAHRSTRWRFFAPAKRAEVRVAGSWARARAWHRTWAQGGRNH